MKWLNRLKKSIDQVQTSANVVQQAVTHFEPVNDSTPLDPDRWCWPHSSAMNSGEIENFAKRAALFNRRGLASLDAELLADVLVTRDREGDNRRACVECKGLTGNGPYQCSPWRQASLGGPVLARQLVVMLQRCNGFTPVADLKVKQ